MRNLAESIRFSADIVRVISDYVSLRQAGSSLKGLCPFHSEKTPSFSVHAERQSFHCFGCGVGGDVFKFVMLIEQVTFPESIRIVAEKCGIPVPKASPAEDRAAREREQLLSLYQDAAAYFSRELAARAGVEARRVLERREIAPGSIERFGLGYAPPYGLLKALNPRDPQKTGLFSKNERGEVYDRFRRRLMFPIWNERGKVIAFGGRILGDGQPKYLNSPETPLYNKSSVLYGLHLAKAAAREAGRMVVVEGYFDCLSLHQRGIENVVASCGTSLTARQVEMLARSVGEVVVNYDPDAAGQEAARRSIELLLKGGLTVRILRLPDGLDPDDYVRREGADAYRRRLEDAPYFWEHLIAEARRRDDISRPEVKSRWVGRILSYVEHISDRIVRLEISRAVAEAFELPERLVLEQAPIGGGSAGPELRERRRLLPAEKQLIQAILQDPGLASSLAPLREADESLLRDVWSAPVLGRLMAEPGSDVERVLEDIDDRDLVQAVREAALEPVGHISAEMALSYVGCLYEQQLIREERELSEQLKRGAGTETAGLLRRRMEIASEKSRLRAAHGSAR